MGRCKKAGEVGVVKDERLSDICYGCGRIGHNSKACTDQVIMNESQDSPLYGPWVTDTRPRSSNRWVTIGGNSKTSTTRDPGRKSWKEIMMGEKEESSQGVPRKGYTRPDNPMSQASSNRTIPMPQTKSRDRDEEAHGGVPSAQSKHKEKLGEEPSPPQSRRSMNSDNSKVDATSLKTILFDLNAASDLEEGEVQQEKGSCDLSLNPMLPVIGASMQQEPDDQLVGTHNHQPIQISDSPIVGDDLGDKAESGKEATCARGAVRPPFPIKVGSCCPMVGSTMELQPATTIVPLGHSARVVKRRGRHTLVEAQTRGAK